ncbi:MAG: LOG family protein [Spirochaetes bacterium]|nr:LOG family protein [Spirochaetota bacterium]
MKEKYISIFGSSKLDQNETDYKIAYELSFKLIKLGYFVMNGGGSGIMKASRDGAYEAGGYALGVIIDNYKSGFYTKKNVMVCNDLYERLKKLTENSEGFVIFSGGIGTLAEFSIVNDLINKSLIKKVPVICFGDHWKPLIDHLKNRSCFIDERSLDFIDFAYSADEILKKLKIT